MDKEESKALDLSNILSLSELKMLKDALYNKIRLSTSTDTTFEYIYKLAKIGILIDSAIDLKGGEDYEDN